MREVGRPDHASTEQLSALLDDRAEPEEQQFLAGHVDRCVVCASELADLRSVRTLLRALPVHLPPRSFAIPVQAAPQVRRFRRLIPLTRLLGAVAAILCVVLFSVDAMTMEYPAGASVQDAPAAMLLPRATTEGTAAKPAARSAAESAANPSDSAPATAPQPAAAEGSSAESAPSAATSRTAYPAAADAAASSAPRPQPATQATAAGAAAPASAPARAAPPPQSTVAAFIPTQSAFAPAVQPTVAAPVGAAATPGQVGIAPATAVPSDQNRPARSVGTSLWLTPIRLWMVGLALAAAVLLIASLVFSRLDRARTGVGHARR